MNAMTEAQPGTAEGKARHHQDEVLAVAKRADP